MKDDSGRFNPSFDTSRLLKLDVDHVLLATGQGTDIGLLEGSAVENTRGFIVADPNRADRPRWGHRYSAP